MRLYFLTDEKRYVHRQSDIPKGAAVKNVEVPTDLNGLMAYLNNLMKANNKPLEQPAVGEVLLTFPETSTLEKLPEIVEREPIENMLSRIDNPKIDVTGVVEIIAASKGYALRRYSGAVAIRFQELSNA